jgi:hypothetical protein
MDPTDVELEFFHSYVEPEIQKLQSEGVKFPTADDLRKAGVLMTSSTASGGLDFAPLVAAPVAA